MILIEGGTFSMGATNGESNEKPKHKVTLDSFLISKYEVTQAEWEAVMGNNPGYFKGANLPVEQVSWYDCVEYCDKRSIAEGLTPVYAIDKTKTDPNNESMFIYDSIKWIVTMNRSANGYRLPTEAEWEFAARGGKMSKEYKHSGSDNIRNVAWYHDNSGSTTHPVGEKQANELGLYDMTGNVWEWCWDWYGSYTAETEVNPEGPVKGEGRILRGGSWDFNNYNLRVFRRYRVFPSSASYYFGFRLVRSFSE